MQTLATLHKMRDGSRREAAEAKAVLARLQRDIEKIATEAGKHEAYRDEKIAAAREKARVEIRKVYQQVAERATISKQELRYWGDSSFLMSMQRFDKDPAVDAQIRAQRMAELNAMPEPVLKLHAEAARGRGELAELWLAHLASVNREFKEPITFDGVEIPQRRDALTAIAAIDGYAAEIELCEADAKGAPATGGEKLTLARRIMAGRETAASIEPAPAGTVSAASPAERLTRARSPAPAPAQSAAQ
jgi:hypothetical protein